MEGVIEDDDGGSAGGGPGVLDGVLDGLAAGVEQRGALRVLARGQPVQGLGNLNVGLVGRGKEAGVGVPRELVCGTGDDRRRRVAHGGDRDAAAQVDERVAVDVDDHTASCGGHVDAGAARQPGREGSLAPIGQVERTGPRNVGDDSAHLLQFGPAYQRVCHTDSVWMRWQSAHVRSGQSNAPRCT